MMILTRDHVLDLLRQHRDEIAAYGVSSLALFGSVARNEATLESDVDILVEFDRPIGLFQFVRLQIELEKILGVSVDLIEQDALPKDIKGNSLKDTVYI